MDSVVVVLEPPTATNASPAPSLPTTSSPSVSASPVAKAPSFALRRMRSLAAVAGGSSAAFPERADSVVDFGVPASNTEEQALPSFPDFLPRYGAVGWTASVKELLFVFGGCDHRGTVTASLQKINLVAGTVAQLSSVRGPSARYLHAACSHPTSKGTAFVFGGCGTAVVHSDLWTWDREEWRELRCLGDGPGKRHSHQIAVSSDAQFLFVVGGTSLTPQKSVLMDMIPPDALDRLVAPLPSELPRGVLASQGGHHHHLGHSPSASSQRATLVAEDSAVSTAVYIFNLATSVWTAASTSPVSLQRRRSFSILHWNWANGPRLVGSGATQGFRGGDSIMSQQSLVPHSNETSITTPQRGKESTHAAADNRSAVDFDRTTVITGGIFTPTTPFSNLAASALGSPRTPAYAANLPQQGGGFDTTTTGSTTPPSSPQHHRVATSIPVDVFWVGPGVRGDDTLVRMEWDSASEACTFEEHRINLTNLGEEQTREPGEASDRHTALVDSTTSALSDWSAIMPDASRRVGRFSIACAGSTPLHGGELWKWAEIGGRQECVPSSKLLSCGGGGVQLLPSVEDLVPAEERQKKLATLSAAAAAAQRHEKILEQSRKHAAPLSSCESSGREAHGGSMRSFVLSTAAGRLTSEIRSQTVDPTPLASSLRIFDEDFFCDGKQSPFSTEALVAYMGSLESPVVVELGSSHAFVVGGRRTTTNCVSNVIFLVNRALLCNFLMGNSSNQGRVPSDTLARELAPDDSVKFGSSLSMTVGANYRSSHMVTAATNRRRSSRSALLTAINGSARKRPSLSSPSPKAQALLSRGSRAGITVLESTAATARRVAQQLTNEKLDVLCRDVFNTLVASGDVPRDDSAARFLALEKIRSNIELLASYGSRRQLQASGNSANTTSGRASEPSSDSVVSALCSVHDQYESIVEELTKVGLASPISADESVVAAETAFYLRQALVQHMRSKKGSTLDQDDLSPNAAQQKALSRTTDESSGWATLTGGASCNVAAKYREWYHPPRVTRADAAATARLAEPHARSAPIAKKSAVSKEPRPPSLVTEPVPRAMPSTARVKQMEVEIRRSDPSPPSRAQSASLGHHRQDRGVPPWTRAEAHPQVKHVSVEAKMAVSARATRVRL